MTTKVSQTQQGGALDIAAHNLRTYISNIDEPWKIVIGFILLCGITYSNQLSSILTSFTHTSLRSIIGRFIGLVFVITIIVKVGWIYGLLTAIAYLLIMKEDSTLEEKEKEVTVEQFSDLVVKARQGNLWFIEKVMNEDPIVIEEDRVETAAIQG